MVKDYDSFTEGSGQGSFDSIPAADTNEIGEPIWKPDPTSLGLLPQIDTNLFIAVWREGVADPERELYMMDLYKTIQELWDAREAEAEGPHITPISPPIMCHTTVKRARSSSPPHSRRMRQRSTSMLSARSAATRFNLASLPFLSRPEHSMATLLPPHSAPAHMASIAPD